MNWRADVGWKETKEIRLVTLYTLKYCLPRKKKKKRIGIITYAGVVVDMDGWTVLVVTVYTQNGGGVAVDAADVKKKKKERELTGGCWW